jgi:hypothetical protein
MASRKRAAAKVYAKERRPENIDATLAKRRETMQALRAKRKAEGRECPRTLQRAERRRQLLAEAAKRPPKTKNAKRKISNILTWEKKAASRGQSSQ